MSVASPGAASALTPSTARPGSLGSAAAALAYLMGATMAAVAVPFVEVARTETCCLV